MFQLGGIITSIINVLIWLALRRRIKLVAPVRGNLYAGILGVVMLALLHPSFAMAIGSWSGLRLVRDALPDWAQILCMGTQFAVWTYAVLHLVIVGPNCIRRFIVWLRQRRKSPTEPEPVNQDRRKLLARAGLAIPAAAVIIAGTGVAGYRAAPHVTRLRLPVRRDMTNLHGVTIAQLSDVHIGSYMDRERLSEFAETANALNADYHVITGDLVDNHIEQVELAQFLIRALKPKRGEVFLCMGNHEYYTARSASMSEMLGGFKDAGGAMLIDEARTLNVGGDKLWLGAIDYPRCRGRDGESGRTTRESLDYTINQMSDDGAPRVILSHHPRTFYDGREVDLDLMLSGHTHGGQINLGRIGDAALTPILPVDFYHNGYYEHDGRRLYVNSGAGGWLPVRVNCPPEITLVELVPDDTQPRGIHARAR